MNLILCEPDEIGGDGAVTLTGIRAAHVRDVLRAVVGDEVRLGIVDGPCGVGVVTALHEHGDRIDLACRFDAHVPPRPAVDLLLALPRPKVLRRLWAQLAAIGVGRIMLTNAARVERNYFDTHVLSEATWHPLLIEGLQQARDTRLPRVSIHRQFRILIEDDLDTLCGDAAASTRLVAHPGETASMADTGSRAASLSPRALLAIGPEGGWNAFELDLLQRHGFVAISTGPRVLRTDTACIALLALLHESLRAANRGAHRAADRRY
jgi:16S rRNA (uracil1498-N3)-methyltransferase